MKYRKLQQQLKIYKKQGLTNINLNSKKPKLEAELISIETALENKNKTFCIIVGNVYPIKGFFLNKDRYSIGRTQESDIRINSPYISRSHATLLRQSDQNGDIYYEIFDGDGQKKLSKNGILVNLKKVNTKQRLKPFDQLMFPLNIIAIYHPFQSFNSEELHFLVNRIETSVPSWQESGLDLSGN